MNINERARQWVAQSDERLVAKALLHLNRLAKTLPYRYDRKVIYDLKNRLVRQFYDAGFCTDVGIHVLTLECYDCGGKGEVECWDDEGDEAEACMCHRCSGTGIYREHTYYHFKFTIHGRSFGWHQPEWAVDWPVETISHQQKFDGRDPRSAANRERFMGLYLAIIEAYLEKVQEVSA